MIERNNKKAWVAGVAAAISDEYGYSVGLIRLGFIASFFVFGIGLLLYMVLWLKFPDANNQIRLNFS